ncbi:hypothetical protein D3C86_1871610 [compost metagenome]
MSRCVLRCIDLDLIARQECHPEVAPLKAGVPRDLHHRGVEALGLLGIQQVIAPLDSDFEARVPDRWQANGGGGAPAAGIGADIARPLIVHVEDADGNV